ncbi:MAG: hypothetical protein JSV25_00140 [Spirochaetota bacterium]|nr:MAG: hypothetical protein JSV25_00140 [Spirochaetota bacterium]
MNKKIRSTIMYILLLGVTLMFFFSCGGFLIKEKIIYEVEGSGYATISYTNKDGYTTIIMNQSLPWYKNIYYLFDEEPTVEKLTLQVTSLTPVTTKITWDR